jgi:integrase/recombinase XerD
VTQQRSDDRHHGGAIRGWSRYLHAIDTTHEVIPDDLIPGTYPRVTPFVFTTTETAALLKRATRLRYALSAATYTTLLGLTTKGRRPRSGPVTGRR